MNTLTIESITKALEGLSLRTAVTAENIANASTQGYRPRRVDFESALARAAQGGGQVSAVRPQIVQDMTQTSVRLDLEMANASGASGRYAALVEILNRQMQIDALAVSGGR